MKGQTYIIVRWSDELTNPLIAWTRSPEELEYEVVIAHSSTERTMRYVRPATGKRVTGAFRSVPDASIYFNTPNAMVFEMTPAMREWLRNRRSGYTALTVEAEDE